MVHALKAADGEYVI